MKKKKNDQARFFIFTLGIDIMLLEVFYRETIQFQRLHFILYVNLIAVYISDLCIIHAYNISNIYHTGQMDHPDIVKE